MSSAGWYFIYATKLHDHDHHNHYIVQVVGVRTQQRLLLLPWQLYHATLVLACVGGGFYQVMILLPVNIILIIRLSTSRC